MAYAAWADPLGSAAKLLSLACLLIAGRLQGDRKLIHALCSIRPRKAFFRRGFRRQAH
jgi:hypothetical protein